MRPRQILRAGTIALIGMLRFVCGCHRPDSQPAQPPDIPQVAAGVAMHDVRFWSAALGREMPYRVFLPEKLKAGETLPVVYLLHGRGADFRDWSDHSDVSKHALNGLILVMPEGNSSFYLNAARNPKDKYEDYIVHDLVADVEARFPAKPGRAHRAIVGISMGGFGAVKLALSHPDTYAFAAGLSSAIDVAERRFGLRRAGLWWMLRQVFGPMGSQERADRDPFVLVQRADPRAVPYFFLTAGNKEALLEPDQRFAAHLKTYGIPYEFHTQPGGHEWSEWNSQLPLCFQRMFEVWSQQT